MRKEFFKMNEEEELLKCYKTTVKMLRGRLTELERVKTLIREYLELSSEGYPSECEVVWDELNGLLYEDDGIYKYWQPTAYQCSECLDIIYSSKPGEFVQCKCRKCFVDQTRDYVRLSGSPTNLGQIHHSMIDEYRWS